MIKLDTCSPIHTIAHTQLAHYRRSNQTDVFCTHRPHDPQGKLLRQTPDREQSRCGSHATALRTMHHGKPEPGAISPQESGTAVCTAETPIPQPRLRYSVRVFVGQRAMTSITSDLIYPQPDHSCTHSITFIVGPGIQFNNFLFGGLARIIRRTTAIDGGISHCRRQFHQPLALHA